MANKKIVVVISGIVFVIAVLALIFVRFVTADAADSEVNWFGGTPTVEKTLEYSSAYPAMTNCQKMTMQVERSYVSSPFEEHCYVPTAMGLMTQLYYTTGVVQAQGYAKAYPVSYRQGGNPIIDPVPNQASGIRSVGYSQGEGSIFGYYPQLSNILQLRIDATSMYYEIPATGNIGYTFSKPGGAAAPFNYPTKSFSKNGRYMVIDGLGAGFIRINLMNLTVRSFSPTLIKINGYSLTTASTAIDDTGRYAAIYYNADGDWGSKYFKLVDVNSCANPETDYNKISDQSTFNCQSVDMLAALKQSVPTVQRVDNIQFSNERTITFDIRYTEGNVTKYARYSMTAPGSVKRVKQYLALGDSYISGEGAYSYRDGTDTGRNQCHQSLLAYPYLLSAKFESFASVACSGASTYHVQEDGVSRTDQLNGGRPTADELSAAVEKMLPGVVPQLDFIKQDNPEAVTISIGGNDIGFGDIIEKCVHPLKHVVDNLESASTCYDTYEDRAEIVSTINSKLKDLLPLYTDLKDDGAASRRVYVIGYPQVAKVGGTCELNVQMNSDEILFAHDLIAYLNSVIKMAADEAGVMYVDTEHAFDGHRLCEAGSGQAAVNGFTISHSADGGYDFKASFHPNQRGHQMLADTIAAQTHNLTASMPTPAPKTTDPVLDPNATILQNVPKTNRALRYVRIVDGLIQKIAHPLSQLDFTLDSQEFLTRANGVYNLVINSDPVNLGNFTADSQGNLAVSAVIPGNIPPGFHTLHVYGTDIYGNPIDIQQVVFVTAANVGDMDGDGAPDNTDSCILATQSGTDIDQDGVDDVCDPLVGEPPLTSGGSDGNPGGGSEAIIWWDKVYMPITIKAISGP